MTMTLDARPAPVDLPEYRLSPRSAIRPGCWIHVNGLGDFRVSGIRRAPSGTIEITAYGGKAGRTMTAQSRVFTPDRIDRVLRKEPEPWWPAAEMRAPARRRGGR